MSRGGGAVRCSLSPVARRAASRISLGQPPAWSSTGGRGARLRLRGAQNSEFAPFAGRFHTLAEAVPRTQFSSVRICIGIETASSRQTAFEPSGLSNSLHVGSATVETGVRAPDAHAVPFSQRRIASSKRGCSSRSNTAQTWSASSRNCAVDLRCLPVARARPPRLPASIDRRVSTRIRSGQRGRKREQLSKIMRLVFSPSQ